MMPLATVVLFLELHLLSRLLIAPLKGPVIPLEFSTAAAPGGAARPAGGTR
jgi:hypothetical protein